MVYDGFIEEYVEKLKNALSGNSEAIEEFTNRVKKEKETPMNIALEIVRKYSGDIHIFLGAPHMKDVSSGYDGNIIGRINSIRCIDYEKDGKKRKRCVGYLEDENGKLPFTIFDPTIQLTKGDFILVKDAKVGEYSGKPYLTLSNRNQISILEKSKNIDASNSVLKIKDLKPEMYSLTVRGNLRVTGSKENVGKEAIKMFSGILTDDTGTIGVRSWGVPLEDGDVEIIGASVKQFKDRLYLNIGKGTEVRILSRRNEAFRTLEQLNLSDRGTVQGVGIVTKIYAKNPVVEVCRECGRIVKAGKCENHPDAGSKKILRISVVLDDGTLSPTVFVYQKNLLSAIGMQDEDAEAAVEKGEAQALISKVEKELIMKFVEFSLYGFRSSNGYYMEMEEMQVMSEEEMNRNYSMMMEELK